MRSHLVILVFILTLCSYSTICLDQSGPNLHHEYLTWYKSVVVNCKPGSTFLNPSNRTCTCLKPGMEWCEGENPIRTKSPKLPKHSEKSPKTKKHKGGKNIKDKGGKLKRPKCSDGPVPRSWYEDCNVCYCPKDPKPEYKDGPICTVVGCGKDIKPINPTVLKKQKQANKRILLALEIEQWAETCKPGTIRKHPMGCGNFCDCVKTGVAACPLHPCAMKKKLKRRKVISNIPKGVEEFINTCKFGEQKRINADKCIQCRCIKSKVASTCVACIDNLP